MQLMLGWWAAVFAISATVAASVRFMFPNVLYEPSLRMKAQRPDDYPDGATFFPEHRFFLMKNGKQFRAVSATCTHLGCTVNRIADGSGFRCPCHGSVFDASGAVTSGPAPKALAWYPVTLSRDERLVIDMTRQVSPEEQLVV
ncbi:MAG: ubiquinol-cytochrome c reductase iron-sulfur subunit [Verrucomicrobia bacterium]|nr:ubiquinol-cytochrome c reductase iron-sulfur subunit [Verrucomicrobiota bacterium]